MLHGWGLHGGVWAPLAEKLAAHFTLHLVDLPGHGHSRDQAWRDLDGIARDVAAHLPREYSLAGWSLGGQVAMRIALHAPPRKLVLIGTTPCFVQRADWHAAMRPEVLADFAQKLATNYRATLNSFLALQVLHDSAARAALRELTRTLFLRGEPHPDVLGEGLDLLGDTDLRPDMTRIAAPTLVLHGDRDALTPVGAGRWLGQHIERAKYVEVEDAAHAPFLSHRDTVADAMTRFLKAT
ncbi:MAG: pimeloyl-ACP methyl ester esterase BioH [Betaproteobacteria bacterium]|nr:pimeloyl-ACP methyl ester esterase BioH [Betaproteobacteria bacterium]